ncbi:MAG TPA: thioredoxin family protein [Pseudonocardiaceae bacterium]|jgi:thiol-disulfide isomerase/thioredoxin|nr:thioredoxin family protein [Pseudonocardiaceae bacterium]
MARTQRSALPAVEFEDLLGVDGRSHSLSSLAGARATVVVFIGNGCPTVRAYEDRLMTMARAWRPTGVELIAINPNNPSLSPPDTLTQMVNRSTARSYNFAYLKDVDGTVARSYGAVCTPHAFVLDAHHRVAYSGRIDDSRMGNTITSRDLENAVSDLVAGQPVAVSHTEPFGCAIVW